MTGSLKSGFFSKPLKDVQLLHVSPCFVFFCVSNTQSEHFVPCSYKANIHNSASSRLWEVRLSASWLTHPCAKTKRPSSHKTLHAWHKYWRLLSSIRGPWKTLLSESRFAVIADILRENKFGEMFWENARLRKDEAFFLTIFLLVSFLWPAHRFTREEGRKDQLVIKRMMDVVSSLHKTFISSPTSSSPRL